MMRRVGLQESRNPQSHRQASQCSHIKPSNHEHCNCFARNILVVAKVGGSPTLISMEGVGEPGHSHRAPSSCPGFAQARFAFVAGCDLTKNTIWPEPPKSKSTTALHELIYCPVDPRRVHISISSGKSSRERQIYRHNRRKCLSSGQLHPTPQKAVTPLSSS